MARNWSKYDCILLFFIGIDTACAIPPELTTASAILSSAQCHREHHVKSTSSLNSSTSARGYFVESLQSWRALSHPHSITLRWLGSVYLLNYDNFVVQIIVSSTVVFARQTIFSKTPSADSSVGLAFTLPYHKPGQWTSMPSIILV